MILSYEPRKISFNRRAKNNSLSKNSVAVFHLSFAGDEMFNEASLTAVALIQKRRTLDEGAATMLT